MIHRYMGIFEDRVYGPPFSAFEGSSGDGDVNIYRVAEDDAAGTATAFTNYNDGGLTAEGMHNPVLSPDGSLIAYTQANASTGLGELWVVANSPASSPTMLVSSATTWINAPMWSPDSSTIVYARGGSAGAVYGGIVETVPAGGGSPTVLYTPGGSDLAYRPAYSYDGAYIAFIKSIAGNDQLWVMESDGTNAGSVDTITTVRLDGSQFGWANNELTIAYDIASTGSNVYVIGHDGTGKTKISNGVTDGATNRVSKFCWPADDSHIIISSNQLGSRMSLYRLELDGSADTELNATHGPSAQGFMKQAFVFENRIWFIETASGASGGRIASTAIDGTDYIEELDVNDSTVLDWFFGGNGFEYQ